MAAQLISLPADDQSHKYESLGYIDAYDAILNCDYAFLAYKEKDTDGNWRVRVKSSQTTGVVFEQDMMRSNSRQAGAQGKPFFTWGAGIDPSAGDARCIQYRVYNKDGQTSEIEVYVVMRKGDGSADTPKSLKFNWPA